MPTPNCIKLNITAAVKAVFAKPTNTYLTACDLILVSTNNSILPIGSYAFLWNERMFDENDRKP